MSRIEIERKFLLNGLPAIPDGAEVWQIDQGYFSPSIAPDLECTHPTQAVGRIRKTVFADGESICTHTIKTGQGLIRNEAERPINDAEFEQLWPLTLGRRLNKTRFRIRHGEILWEIDQFSTIDLVLAEVELPAPTTAVAIPDWVRPHLIKEVTDEPAYTNAAIAVRLGTGDVCT